MKCIMLMFDSLNRHMLPPYGGDWVHAPNFQRLAKRAVTFETSYVCSMPCMPARRDLHTGRPNFLHCPWGPLEPFDDSVVSILKQHGVYTHLTSDHYHYWEDGGATYHTRYNTWEFFRGQEGDPWIGQVGDPTMPWHINPPRFHLSRQDWVNRQYMRSDAEHSQTRTIASGLDFIRRNSGEDNWFLQIECFDPHEPFFAHREWKDLYPSPDESAANAPLFDWPPYEKVTQSPAEVDQARRNYAALMSKCDASLGYVLDAMDEHGLWEDTMLVVWTDHGYLLGEHGCWAKNWMPLYEQVARTPFFIYDPRHKDAAGQRRTSLVQPSIDLGPTLLRLFGAEPTADMLGHDLSPVIARDGRVRDAAIFGYHGQWVNVTDGRYVYMRAPVDGAELYRYTLMPAQFLGQRNRDVLQAATLAGPFPFTKGVPVLKIGGRAGSGGRQTLLWDVQADPGQETPLRDQAIEQRMVEHLTRLMQQCHAPAEQYARMGLA